MPLIIITGIPASGKTTRTEQLKKHFEELGKTVHIVSEWEAIRNSGFGKDEFYKDSQKEKRVRGFLRSEVVRLVTPENIVILDGSNYIKGFRYELYCATKANNCNQCTLHCEINRTVAWNYNENRDNDEEKYSRETFDALVLRYEDPEARNRWDSPLYVCFPEDTLDLTAITESLLNRAPPPPNMSTQNPPLSSTNFLYELDRVTQDLNKQILEAKSMGVYREWKAHENISISLEAVTPQKLAMFRRQYITYSKMHTPDAEKIPQLYLQFLKTSLAQ